MSQHHIDKLRSIESRMRDVRDRVMTMQDQDVRNELAAVCEAVQELAVALLNISR